MTNPIQELLDRWQSAVDARQTEHHAVTARHLLELRAALSKLVDGKWTVGYHPGETTPRFNCGEQFELMIERVAELVGNARLVDNPRSVAGLIMAQLAHEHHLAPLPSFEERNAPARKSTSK